MIHQIDVSLIANADCTPATRLEVLWTAYERNTESSIERPPSEAERARVHTWLRSLRSTEPDPSYMVRHRHLRLLASLSVTEKAGTVVQLACTACETIVHEDGSMPLNVITPIDVDPWSSQSQPDRTRIRSRVTEAMLDRGRHSPYGEGALCVTVVSVVPARRRRMDADNLVKGLLDSLQGVLYEDDRQIQCLTARRMEYSGVRGHYLVAARAVHPWNADVVFDDPTPATILSGRID